MYLFSSKLHAIHHTEVKCVKANNLLQTLESKFSSLCKASDSLGTFS